MRSRSFSSSFASTRTSARRRVFSCRVVAQLPGLLTLSIGGKRAGVVFENEAGGHRWQRVPPSEKRGRVHTSTVTVAVLEDEVIDDIVELGPVRIKTVRGTGPGGQHRNTSDTCVVATHLETGIQARCDDQRSQDQNRRRAIETLRERVASKIAQTRTQDRSHLRREQIGSGMRGDKRRTVRVRDGRVHDHITGRKWDLKRYLAGDWR